MDNDNMVNDLITITSRLVVLMTTEIERLRAHRPRDIEELQEEKASLARAYETLIRELSKKPEMLAGLAPALREELAARIGEFEITLVQNEASLRAAKAVNSRILKAIADAVAKSQAEHAGYSKTGARENGKRGGDEVSAPVALDTTL